MGWWGGRRRATIVPGTIVTIAASERTAGSGGAIARHLLAQRCRLGSAVGTPTPLHGMVCGEARNREQWLAWLDDQVPLAISTRASIGCRQRAAHLSGRREGGVELQVLGRVGEAPPARCREGARAETRQKRVDRAQGRSTHGRRGAREGAMELSPAKSLGGRRLSPPAGAAGAWRETLCPQLKT